MNDIGDFHKSHGQITVDFPKSSGMLILNLQGFAKVYIGKSRWGWDDWTKSNLTWHMKGGTIQHQLWLRVPSGYQAFDPQPLMRSTHVYPWWINTSPENLA